LTSKGEKELQLKYNTTSRANAFYENQMLSYLNEKMIQFISEQEIMFVSTADSKGNCDLSIRTGKPGFIYAVNESTVIYPEFRGNGVMASMGNIQENPHVALLIIDFFKYCVGLHINGKAQILDTDELFQRHPQLSRESFSIEGKAMEFIERWIAVEVDEAYIHCSKHIPLLKKIPKEMNWGTDNELYKKGDFFKVKPTRKTYV
jgi:predicted pyridoxine 5'-phosphate oxidase superfamily flavin-nucleotide-binding protein